MRRRSPLPQYGFLRSFAPPKDPELVTVDGKTGVRVYLCGPCAKVLRDKNEAGDPLATIDLRWLCEACQCSARRGQERAGAS